MFEPLETPPIRWSLITSSLFWQSLVVAGIIAIPVSVAPHEAPKPRQVPIALYRPPPPHPAVVQKRVRAVKAPVALPVRLLLPMPVAPVRVMAKVEVAAAPAPVILAAAPAPIGIGTALPEHPAAAGGVAHGSGRGGVVQMGGFSNVTAAPLAPVSHAAPVVAMPAQTPVEITFKPKPTYTDQARAQKVEGEVQLEVVFTAAGAVDVLRVVKSLGLGLDESARDAAAHIRFHPATKGGSPVDVRGIVHIAFELS